MPVNINPKKKVLLQKVLDLPGNLGRKMRVKLEPETAFIGKKFAYIFFGIIFGLNAIAFFWYFLFSNLT